MESTIKFERKSNGALINDSYVKQGNMHDIVPEFVTSELKDFFGSPEYPFGDKRSLKVTISIEFLENAD